MTEPEVRVERYSFSPGLAKLSLGSASSFEIASAPQVILRPQFAMSNIVDRGLVTVGIGVWNALMADMLPPDGILWILKGIDAVDVPAEFKLSNSPTLNADTKVIVRGLYSGKMPLPVARGGDGAMFKYVEGDPFTFIVSFTGPAAVPAE